MSPDPSVAALRRLSDREHRILVEGGGSCARSCRARRFGYGLKADGPNPRSKRTFAGLQRNQLNQSSSFAVAEMSDSCDRGDADKYIGDSAWAECERTSRRTASLTWQGPKSVKYIVLFYQGAKCPMRFPSWIHVPFPQARRRPKPLRALLRWLSGLKISDTSDFGGR